MFALSQTGTLPCQISHRSSDYTVSYLCSYVQNTDTPLSGCAVRSISGKAGTTVAAATKLYFDKDLCITRKQGIVRLELSAARS